MRVRVGDTWYSEDQPLMVVLSFQDKKTIGHAAVAGVSNIVSGLATKLIKDGEAWVDWMERPVNNSENLHESYTPDITPEPKTAIIETGENEVGMKIKIGNTWFDEEVDGPFMLVLDSSDKKNIANMAPEATKYAIFKDGLMTEDEMREWMNE